MGRPKKYRRPAVIEAVATWKKEFGDKPFTGLDLYRSGFIKLKMSHQSITENAVNVILGELKRKGEIEVVEDGAIKKKSKYRVP